MAERLSPYIIGETAYNHEGDFKYLLRMVDSLGTIGLNAIKFHILLEPESYIQRKHPLVHDVKKWTFSTKQWDVIIERSSAKGLDVIMLCDDVASINYILKSHSSISAIEIHATSINDIFILDAASKFPGRIMLGVGGSTVDEIMYAINFLKMRGRTDLVLMYGFQSYPTNYADINLSKMLKLKELFHMPVGYADHTAYDDPNNEAISVMAAMMGFNILEKHYTPDLGKVRIDYQAAVDKKALSRIKESMKLALTVYGNGELTMSKAELDYGNVGPMKKAIVARKPIRKGEKLSYDNLWFKRTQEGSHIKQTQFLQLIGLVATQDIDEDEIIDFNNVKYEFKKAELGDFGVKKGSRGKRE